MPWNRRYRDSLVISQEEKPQYCLAAVYFFFCRLMIAMQIAYTTNAEASTTK